MIRKIGQAFVLDTAHTTYAFSILPGGHPEHLYYGRTIHIDAMLNAETTWSGFMIIFGE